MAGQRLCQTYQKPQNNDQDQTRIPNDLSTRTYDEFQMITPPSSHSPIHKLSGENENQV